jgi:hypothetical protein
MRFEHGLAVGPRDEILQGRQPASSVEQGDLARLEVGLQWLQQRDQLPRLGNLVLNSRQLLGERLIPRLLGKGIAQSALLLLELL